MTNLREQYERETGENPMEWVEVSGVDTTIFTPAYVAWLERELAAAHELLDLCCDAPLKLEIAKQSIEKLKRKAMCAEELSQVVYHSQALMLGVVRLRERPF